MAGKKRNIILRLQHWMDSVAGQSFLNYAYSWGAAIVILGALFKLTHIQGADVMLFIGMSTEVFVFFISAFDRPSGLRDEESEQDDELAQEPENESSDIVSGAGMAGGSAVSQPVSVNNVSASDAASSFAAVSAAVSLDTQKLIEIVQEANKDLMEQARAVCAPEMGEAARNYVKELEQLTAVLRQVSEQSRHLTDESEEMEKLNRTLTSINTIYEMQLKNVSLQIGTMDQINEQTRRMTHLIEELNNVYARMIQAMTVNMSQNGQISQGSAQV